MKCAYEAPSAFGGFIDLWSTLSQLLLQHDLVLSLLENGGNVDQVYLDFSKAFDKVDHTILLRKARGMGITGSLGTWLGRFLLNRRQAVRVGPRTSSWMHILSGMPQGSVLGPLLFLIFISDLGANLGPGASTILKYVDDTKVIRGVSSPEEVEALHWDLESLYTWQEDNNMEWNSTKFLALCMGANLPLMDETIIFTPGHEDPILVQEVVKDLGVLVDHQASFKAQRAKVVSKTTQKAS